jgi:multisubunit Na+/H+ antiporter MnhF subunit
MNPWLVSATVMLGSLVCALAVIATKEALDGVVALELTGAVVTQIMLLIAVGFGDTSFGDLCVVLAFLSLGGGLVFARFMERWL